MKSGLSPLRYLALIALAGCASAATTPGAPRFVSA